MSRKGAIFVTFLAILVCLCAPLSMGAAASSRRIVSLAPSITESLDALGLLREVVGVSDYDVFPPEVTRLPKVGGYDNPSIEKILSLKPTLVLGDNTFHRALLSRLSRMGIETEGLTMHHGLDQIREALLLVGSKTGKRAEAQVVWKGIERDLDRERQRVATRFPQRKPRILVIVWDHPLTVAGKANYVDALIERLSLRNAAEALDRPFPQISRETLISLDPDIIVLTRSQKGMNLDPKTFTKTFSKIPLRALKGHKVVLLPGDLLFHPGPRVTEAARCLVDAVIASEGGEASCAVGK